MNQSVFLDRDGVLTRLIHNPESEAYEAPHFVHDLELMDDVISSLDKLKKMNLKLFLISNQPDYAKGKATLVDIKKIENKFKSALEENDVGLDEYYYCYHHPDGIVPEYSQKCDCRKPGLQFLEKAKDKYNLDLKKAWFIGDRDTDIFCGTKAGVRTILVNNPLSKDNRGNSIPDFEVQNIKEAIKIIEFEKKKGT